MPTGNTTKKAAAKKAAAAVEAVAAVEVPVEPELTVTSLEEWAQEGTGFIQKLPSGKVCRMKRTLDLAVQLQGGMIPNPLADIIRKAMDTNDVSAFAGASQDKQAMIQMMGMIDRTVCDAVTEPRISMPDPRGEDETDEAFAKRMNEWRPDEGTLSIFLVTMEDRAFIAAVAQGRATDLAGFRAEQTASLAALQESREVRRAAQRAPGAKRKQ